MGARSEHRAPDPYFKHASSYKALTRVWAGEKGVAFLQAGGRRGAHLGRVVTKGGGKPSGIPAGFGALAGSCAHDNERCELPIIA